MTKRTELLHPTPAAAAVEEALRVAIWKDPTNRETLRVYADWLAEQGSTRGEYMQLCSSWASRCRTGAHGAIKIRFGPTATELCMITWGTVSSSVKSCRWMRSCAMGGRKM